MDSQPQNPNPRTNSQNHKRKRNMDKLKRAVLGAMTLDSATPLSEETKKYIEKRLLQFFPVIRTPDHPPYAAMILDTIKTLNEKRGSSEKSLSEFIKSNYEVPWAHSSYLSHHLCKLAQNGDIVVTSDDRYMIPSVNPNPNPKPNPKPKPKEKQQKRKCYQGRGGRGNPLKEAVVEETNQLGGQEQVEIKELSQAQKHENSVIDEAKEQDYQVNEGNQQNEVRSELLQSCLNDDDCATLMVIPVESSSPRVEDEEEESVEELQKQRKRSKCPSDSLPPLSPQHHFEKQQPQYQHKVRASMPEEDTDTGSLLSLGLPQHTRSQHRGRGRPPKPKPDTITSDEALLPLPHESSKQHPPQNRGRGRPCKLKPDAETTIGEFFTSQNPRRGRPHKPKPDSEFMIGDFSTSQNPIRGRPRKPKPDAQAMTVEFSTSQNLRWGKRKPHFDTTMETDNSNQIIHID